MNAAKRLAARLRKMTLREWVLFAVVVVCPGGLVVAPILAKVWRA